MREDSIQTEPSGQTENPGKLNDNSSIARLVYVMLSILVVGAIGIWIFVDARNALGFLFGSAIAIANLFWMRATLGSVFAKVAHDGVKRYSVLGHAFRYVVLGAIIFAIYKTELLPIASVLVGLAIFAFAVLFEGMFRLISTLLRHEES